MKIITHRPFLYIAMFYSLGIVLGYFTQIPFGYSCFLVLVSLLLGVRMFQRPFISTVLLLFAIAGLGAVYTQNRQCVDRDHVMFIAKYHRKQPIQIKGVIVSDVQSRRAINGLKTTFTLDVHQVKAPWGWQKKTGKILVNVFRALDVYYGDDVVLEGKLHRPYNFSTGKNFSYRDYLHHRDIYFIVSVKKSADVQVLGHDKGNYFKSISLKLRGKLKNILVHYLSGNEAGIMQAILLGDRSGISKPIRTLFVQTGTAHILAISGLHMGIVAALFLAFAKVVPIGRRGQLTVVILLLVGYAFLTGGRPSVVRATIMAVVFLASFIVEREFDVLNTLCLAAMVILMINPLNLFDVGFQLSFVCVFSIIYFNLRIRKKKAVKPLRRDSTPANRAYHRWTYCILQSFNISLAIWIGVAGLIAYYFGIVTPVTIFANPVVVPLISIIVALGFGLLAVGVIFPPCAFMFATCLKVVLNVMAGFIYMYDKIPFSHIYIKEVNLWHVGTYYIILCLAIFCPWGWIWPNLIGGLPRIFRRVRIDKRLRV